MNASNSLRSTPSKIRSSQTHTASTPTSSRTQSELLDIIARELDDQTYEFEPDVVARMLSPKLPRKNVELDEHPALGDFECLIDEPTVQNAIQEARNLQYTDWNSNEVLNYTSMAAFLTNCVQECDKIYDIIHEKLPRDNRFTVAARAKRWLPQLCFTKHDKKTGDGTQNSSPLKPDLVGLDHPQAVSQEESEIVGWWRSPCAETGVQDHNCQIKFAVEMTSRGWMVAVKQAATYARSQFDASPLRSFVPVIAINHTKQDFRFFIFHRGGLTASKALKLDGTGGGCGFLKILLSILLWQSPEDAGLPAFISGQTFHLPETKAIGVGGMWNMKQTYCHSLSVRGRSTYVVSLESMNNGTEKAVSAVIGRNLNLPTVISRETCQPFISQPPLNKLGSLELTSKVKTNPYTAQRTSLSNSSRPPEETTAANFHKRSADEATLGPISHCEKRHRLLPAVRPQSIIAPGNDIKPSLPSTLVVKCSWPSMTKEYVEPRMYAACGNAFGTPQVLGSFVPCFRENQPMCNSIFLPPKGEDPSKYHWAVFQTRDSNKPPIPVEVDSRRLWITVLADEGCGLDACSSAQDLLDCLLHSMIGWLSMYQHGYLHRDISIGNILKLKKPVERRPFNALEFTRLIASGKEKDELIKSDFNTEVVSRFIEKNYSKSSEHMELLKLAQDLQEALTQCGLSTECKSIIIDGDLAAYIPDYFKSKHNTGSFFGTAEFMSYMLLFASKTRKPYLHTPLDDLWSFFWTALWATLHNCHYRDQQSEDEKVWRCMLRQGGDSREGVATMLRFCLDPDGSSSTLWIQMAPTLREWLMSLEKNSAEWTHEMDMAEDETKVKNDFAGTMHLLFQKFAYCGVLNFVRVYSNYNEKR